MATETIILRAAAIWTVGLLLLAWLSVYAARLSKPGGVPLWLGMLSIVATIFMGAGLAGFPVVLARFTAALDRNVALVLLAASVLAALWANSIFAQFFQNFVYRLFGLPTRRIIWIRGMSRPRRRTRRRTTA